MHYNLKIEITINNKFSWKSQKTHLQKYLCSKVVNKNTVFTLHFHSFQTSKFHQNLILEFVRMSRGFYSWVSTFQRDRWRLCNMNIFHIAFFFIFLHDYYVYFMIIRFFQEPPYFFHLNVQVLLYHLSALSSLVLSERWNSLHPSSHHHFFDISWQFLQSLLISEILWKLFSH